MAYIYILLTILLTVYGQIIIKWQVNYAGAFPGGVTDKILFLLRLLLNPWVISSFLCAFLASLTWMAALTKLPLSFAYPFMSLSFVLVMVLSSIYFYEPITIPKAVGMGLIVVGIIIGSQR
jgi:multidrug transporter EmrE-like cation transporter